MENIKINNQEIKISTSGEKALRILKDAGFIAKLSDFWVGSNRHKRNLFEDIPDAGILGVKLVYKFACKTVKQDNFFKSNPRCKIAIDVDARRINAILKKLDA
jgi:hypothetical protein